MWGGGIVWFYTHLAGLRPLDAGYRTFEVAPIVPEGLERVEYSLDTVYGTIDIAWRVAEGEFVLECGVPVGTKAKIILPGESDGVEVGQGLHNFSKKLK
jgi:alpha-L-rhamnosidase